MANRYMPLVDYRGIDVSAPGRVIIMGEFADLYEKNSIAVTIESRLLVEIRPYKEGRLRLRLQDYQTIREWPTTSIGMNRLVNKFADYLEYTDQIPAKLHHLLHKRYYQTDPPDDCSSSAQKEAPLGSTTRQADDAVMAFLILYAALGDSFAKSARPPLEIVVKSEIPINQGLGSSSAYGLALTAALMKVFRVSAEPYVTCIWAAQIDKFFHKFSSGLSSSTIIHGGYCHYQHNKVKGYGIKHQTVMRIMIIDSGCQRHPRQVYDLVADLVKQDYTRVNNVFINIGDETSGAWKMFNDQNFNHRSVKYKLKSNQDLLDSLGLGNESISDICDRARSCGFEVKQTHCGRTAFLLYGPSDIGPEFNEFRKNLRTHGYSYRDYCITYDGLEVTKIPI